MFLVNVVMVFFASSPTSAASLHLFLHPFRLVTPSRDHHRLERQLPPPAAGALPRTSPPPPCPELLLRRSAAAPAVSQSPTRGWNVSRASMPPSSPKISLLLSSATSSRVGGSSNTFHSCRCRRHRDWSSPNRPPSGLAKKMKWLGG